MPVNLERDYENESLQYESMQKVDKIHMIDTRYRGLLKLTALCLGVICILQATLNITLRLHFNQLNTSYGNLTNDELWTRYTNLDEEKNQLQTSYNNLNAEKDQLQSSYNNLNAEKDQLQSSYNNLDTKLKKLYEMFPRVVEIISLGWKPFDGNIYYFSTEKKNWFESMQYCTQRGADLVIVNNQKEEDFILEQLGNKSAWVGLSKHREDEWRWVNRAVLKTGNLSLEQANDGNSKPYAGISIEAELKKNWISMPCAQEEWWVCEKIIFE